ncbi:MAG: DsbA family protein [Robiginitomaculum sp.]|nr:DsbA family protein [Robiginitomaculum sp.]
MNRPSIQIIALSAIISAIVSFGAVFTVLKTNNKSEQPIDEASAYVKKAMLNDPQMLEDVIAALQAAREMQELVSSKDALVNAGPALFNDKRDAVVGSLDARFVLVEFYDYNCGYCKLAANWTKELLENNPGEVRIIYKEFPVLEGRAPGSQEASLASMAAWQQGAEIFKTFHYALMANDGSFDSARIDELASSSGVDVQAMRAVMQNNDAAFKSHLQETMMLARSLNIDGTPAFIANGVLVHGANTDQLQQIFDQSQEET